MSIHQQKMVRFTLDMPKDMHEYLKHVCEEECLSMSTLVTNVFEEKFEREDRIDCEIYEQGMKELSEHGAIPFDQAMKEIGL